MNNLKIIIILSTLFYFSCNQEYVVDRPTYILPQTNYAYNQDTENDGQICCLTVNIVNDAQNVILEIDDIEFQNIEIFDYPDISHYSIEYQSDISVGEFKLLPQHLKRGMSYIILTGRVYCPTYTIYEGLIYIPISGEIKTGNNTLVLKLYDNCPWYYVYNNKLVKLLQSIQFDIDVEEWEMDAEVKNE